MLFLLSVILCSFPGLLKDVDVQWQFQFHFLGTYECGTSHVSVEDTSVRSMSFG